MFINLPNTQCLIDPLTSDAERVLRAHKDVAGWVKHTKGDSLETLIRKFIVFVHRRVYVKGDSSDESIKKLVNSSKKSSSRIFRAGTVLKKLIDDFVAPLYHELLQPQNNERKRKGGSRSDVKSMKRAKVGSAKE